MDKATLVSEQVEAGEKLLQQLPQAGFDLMAVFWLRATEDGRWRFYVISPVVETEGIAQAYRQIRTVIQGMPQPFVIDPLKVKAIGPSDPLARDILAIFKRFPNPPLCPYRWPGTWLGNMSVEEVCLYPLPVAASSG